MDIEVLRANALAYLTHGIAGARFDPARLDALSQAYGANEVSLRRWLAGEVARPDPVRLVALAEFLAAAQAAGPVAP